MFYTTENVENCIGEAFIYEKEDYYIVYTSEYNLNNIVNTCFLTDEQYTFPEKIEVYEENLFKTFNPETNFRIILDNKVFGETPPQQVSVKAKETKMKILNLEETTIENKNVILQVW